MTKYHHGEYKDYAFHLGARDVHTILRFPRDYEAGRLRGFTGRALADMDSNLFNQAVPAGQRWAVQGLSLVAEHPKAFTAMRDLCNEFPTAFASLKVPNMESLGSVSLSAFWTDGEYILHPRHALGQGEATLPDMTLFMADITFPEYGESKQPAELAIKNIMGNVGLRLTLHVDVWARP